MTIDIQKRGSISIVRLTGQFRGEGDLIKALGPVIDTRGARVIIDMNGVDYVSSAGLGELVRITAQANSQGARVVQAAIQPFVMGVYGMTQLHKFFESYPTVEAAEAALA